MKGEQTLREDVSSIKRTGFSCLSTSVEPRFNDPRYNDIPGITINIRLPSKRNKMNVAGPGYSDLGITIFPGLTMGMSYTKTNVYYINSNYHQIDVSVL